MHLVPEIVKPSEFDPFLETLRKPLPVTFRVNPIYRKFEAVTERFMRKDVIMDFQNEENKYELKDNYGDLHLTCLPFYPQKLLF